MLLKIGWQIFKGGGDRSKCKMVQPHSFELVAGLRFFKVVDAVKVQPRSFELVAGLGFLKVNFLCNFWG